VSRSLVKKCWVVAAIMLMTSSVYMGSSIWSPATMDGAMYFGVGEVTATLGLSLFVLGYGVGPLFLAPITEIPAIGRTPPYIITLALFCILQVPTALVTNFAGLAILRFLAGFIGSPPLTGGTLTPTVM
jgi:DHA1 family multidrug resistance protein-like MFS transporter